MKGVEFRSLLDELANAWWDKRYIDAVKLFTPDIRYVDPIRYSLSGRQALLAFFKNDEGYAQVTTSCLTKLHKGVLSSTRIGVRTYIMVWFW